ncbi:MAG TPA: GNAT family N-acetyltransferase [Nocardia sp.]|uniref:GNAT family N-acetyltransferase n=1 Tax=Nocardia TaxID=1817 RepID=UPI0024565642|nr:MULTISPECIES: GNAT family N-acetyltransferase [Nocardia]HLS79453.1 GNAT family N-acetyltransferase [Nocardia sp.]
MVGRTDIETDQQPILRGATRADLSEICELERVEFRELAWPYPMLRQLYDLHGALWSVAETDRRVGGYALLGIGRTRGWMLGLAVHPEARGRGLARALLERTIRTCRAHRVESVCLTVRSDNHVAVGLYEKAGFVRIGYEDDYFGTGEGREVMALPIERPGRPVIDPTEDRWIKRPRPSW